jgi:hypothetical protein
MVGLKTVCLQWTTHHPLMVMTLSVMNMLEKASHYKLLLFPLDSVQDGRENKVCS